MELYGLFALYLVRNVAGDFGSTNDLPRFIAHGRDGQRNRYLFSRPCDADGLIMIYGTARLNLANDGVLFVLEISRNKRIYRLSYNFRFAVPEDPLCALIPAHDDTVKVFAYDRIV